MNSTAVAENANRMSKDELLELKEALIQKALTKKRIKTATTIAENIMVTNMFWNQCLKPLIKNNTAPKNKIVEIKKPSGSKSSA